MAKEKKPGDYKSRLSRFEATLSAYIEDVGDIKLDDIKKAYKEMGKLKDEYFKTDSLRGKYSRAMDRAGAVLTVEKRKAKIPAPKEETKPGPTADDITTAVTTGIQAGMQPLTEQLSEQFVNFTKQLKSVASEQKLTPGQRAEKKVRTIERKYTKQREATVAGGNEDADKLKSQMQSEIDAVRSEYGVTRPEAAAPKEPEQPKRGFWNRDFKIPFCGKKEGGE